MPDKVASSNRTSVAGTGYRLSLLLPILLAGVQTACRSNTQRPNPVRDLLVDRIGWQTYPTAGGSAGQGIEHRFALTNTSARDSYRQIRLCFDYYTQAGQRLGADTSVVDTLVMPGTMIKLTSLRVGHLLPGTDRTDIRVLGATAD